MKYIDIYVYVFFQQTNACSEWKISFWLVISTKIFLYIFSLKSEKKENHPSIYNSVADLNLLMLQTSTDKINKLL